ncbi:cell division protein ZapE [Piscinibacterium candidicorallinum]|uniref:Cell division protein ZapE n=1 Tax=Piscinibacterium candidicorallinum TaxID=1793872 RepID=A0ABV7H303_9BURK
MPVQSAYENLLQQRGYTADPAQLAAVERLQRLHDEFVEYKRRRASKLMRMISPPPLPQGVWLWGGVGRGKSFLMDCFYDTVPVIRKTRIHFHEFMRGIHAELDHLRGTEDPLGEVAKRTARKYRLICFDEFHVSDVATAMILERLLRPLFEYGVVFVMTSNFEPDGLYPDGLHRDRILGAIELLKQNLDVMNVDAGIDYRKRSLEQAEVYLVPGGEASQAKLTSVFNAVAERNDENPVLRIEHREIRARRRAGGAVWFDFQTLCGGPRSQNDYLELARQFHTVILSDVPEMGVNMASEARRFTWLVDVLYDHKVKLFISAAVPPEALYTQGQFANEFHRTVSRLIEMQSREYLDAERRRAVEL